MTDTSEITAQQYVERANALSGFGRQPDAILELRKGLSTYPDDPELLSLLASFEYFYGDTAAGVTAAKSALAARPADYRASTVLLEHSIREEQFDDARQYAELQIANYPNWGPSYLNLAHVQLNTAWAANRNGKPTAQQHEAWGREVAENTRKGLELDPEGEETLRRATHLLKDVKLKAEAIEVLDRALALYPTSEALQLLASELKASDDIEESKILLGVLAENPQQRAAARQVNANIWGRVQHLSVIVPWMLAVLLIVAAFVTDSGTGSGSGTSRTDRQFVQLFVVVPFAFLLGLFRFKTQALPKCYLRRMFKQVWWIWLGFVTIGLASALMLLLSLALVYRLQPKSIEINGTYMGGISAFIGAIAIIGLLAELLTMWARFASEAKNKLYPIGDEGIAATRQELRALLWTLPRVAVGVAIALVPIVASSIVFRPETLGGFAAVAIAVGAPSVIRVVWMLGRLASVSGQSIPGKLLRTIAGVLSLASLAATALFAYQHMLQNDPPPTPWEIQMQEDQKDLNNQLGDLDIPDLSDLTIPQVTIEPYDPSAP